MAVQGGKLKCTPANGVKIYSIACEDQSLAPWLPSKKLKQKAVRKNSNYLELVQDLRFETATTKIKLSPDGEFLIASGVYPPQVKVYELGQHALKFERHLDSEIIDFEILGDDYSKLAFLCADRSVYLHAKYGKHYSLRIPRMGRDMKYDCWSCDLLCAASSPDLYRINLEQGRFLSALSTQSPALNVVARSKLHGLVACGGEDGAVECFDMRTRSSIARINGVAPTGDADQEVTAIEFDEDGGFLMAVGTSKGKVLLYDLRSSHPIRIKDHMYGGSILDIKWHHSINSERPKLISTDNKIVNIWDPESVNVMTSIEPAGVAQGKINDICVFKGSGLMMLALDCSEITSHFLPALGPAPKWCSYLESLTEELEEDGQVNIYDGLIFLTMEDLERLNATQLIGTNLLRAFAHGYFMDYRLYAKAKQVADPISRESYIEQKKKQKIEEECASRITVKKKLPKANRGLAARLEAEKAEQEEDIDGETKKKTKKKKVLDPGVFEDERFADMFINKEYEIDEQSREYLSLHPMGSQKSASLVDEHFEAVMEESNEGDTDASASQGDSDDDEDGRMKKKSRAPRLYEVKDERHAEAFFKSVSLAKENSLTMGERAAALQQRVQRSGLPDGVKVGPGGSREVSFVSRSSAKYVDSDSDGGGQQQKRRGVQPLGLKPDHHRFGGQGRGRGGRGGGRGMGGRGGGRGMGGRGGRGGGRGGRRGGGRR